MIRHAGRRPIPGEATMSSTTSCAPKHHVMRACHRVCVCADDLLIVVWGERCGKGAASLGTEVEKSRPHGFPLNIAKASATSLAVFVVVFFFLEDDWPPPCSPSKFLF